jgi:hypothetical protein
MGFSYSSGFSGSSEMAEMAVAIDSVIFYLPLLPDSVISYLPMLLLFHTYL